MTVCVHPQLWQTDILAFIQSSRNIIDADSDDENELNNAVPDPTLSEMRNIMKKWCSISVYDHQQKRERNKINNFGCSLAEAEKSASNASMWRKRAADVRPCRFAYGNPSPSERMKN
ncbi:hypothetical protein TNCV_3058931 [Trichonephila clavipes]|nr:hypothetical protein TNCV_3058931 [Trichonephila clavipes]